VIKKPFGTFAAKVAVAALAGGFATGGLVAAGAFTGGAAPHEAVHVAGPSVTQAKVAVEATSTATVADPEDPKPTSTAKADPEEHQGLPTATVTPKPVPPTSTVEGDDADEGVTGTVEADDADDTDSAAAANHGNCVAYAASILHMLGLTGEQNGAFISLVAKDKTAVTSKVAAGGTPDAACLTALAKAKVAAMAAAVTATVDDHGHDGENHDGTNHDGAKNEGAKNDGANHEATQPQSNEDKGGRH
jgi:hypothetical protein